MASCGKREAAREVLVSILLLRISRDANDTWIDKERHSPRSLDAGCLWELWRRREAVVGLTNNLRFPSALPCYGNLSFHAFMSTRWHTCLQASMTSYLHAFILIRGHTGLHAFTPSRLHASVRTRRHTRPIHSSSLTMYEQQVSTSRPWPSMRTAPWSRNIWQSRKHGKLI